MMLLDRLPEPRPHHVRIDLGSRDIGVAQHGLNTAQVRPPFQQVSREAMPDYVGCQIVENAYLLPVQDQQFPKRLPGEAPAAGGYKQELAGAAAQQLRPGLVQILPHRHQSGLADRRDALLISLSDGTQNTAFKLDVGEAQSAQLGDAQSRGIEQLEHGAIPYAGWLGRVGSGKQALDFISIRT